MSENKQWIAMQKSLRTDPNVLIMASKLKRTVAEILGGLFLLWSIADDHGESLDGMTSDILDSQLGITGFCDAMPKKWLQKRSNAFHLPNYDKHNGKEAKARKLSTERVRKHRENKRNAECNAEALPDQTNRYQTRLDKTKTNQQPSETVALKQLAGYAAECCSLNISVGDVGVLFKAFGSVAWLVQVFEHLASRDPGHWDTVKNPVGFVRSLVQKVRDGIELEPQGEYETFECWVARRDDEIERVQKGGA